MSDENSNSIELSLDSKAILASIQSLLSQVSLLTQKFGQTEDQVRGTNDEIKELTKPQLQQKFKELGQTLAGVFTESSLKLKALQGQMQEFRAQAFAMVAQLGALQAQTYKKVATAVRETQITQFQNTNNAGYESDTDLARVKLRREAELRRVQATQLSGGAPDPAAAKRLSGIQAVEESIIEKEGQRKILVDETNKIRATSIQQLASINDVERQTLEVKRAQQALDRERKLSNNTLTTDVQKRVEVLQTEKNKLAEIKAVNKPAAATLDQKAQNANDQTLARLNLNGGSDFFKIQTQILANYQLVATVLSTVRDSVGFVTQFEASLKELQAITGSTNTELDQMSKKFLEVSQNSKFSAADITKAAVILGQAGLSPSEINSSISDIVKLATATGTTLATAVDLATSAMGIFNLRATEMGNVADQVSAALNASKLDAGKLAQGLQYVGNIAATSGVSFTELTAAMSLMTNAGIKSGSTLGTGFRQILNDLISPSAKLQQAFKDLGISTADIDIKSQGVFGVLKNLQAAGFTTADALRTMELRGAAAFTALTAQLPNAEAMVQTIANTGDASKAAATQMDSVEATIRRFANSAGTLAVNMSGPLIEAFKGIVNPISTAIAWVSKFQTTLEIMGTIIGGVIVTAFTRWLVPLGLAVAGLGRVTAAAAATTAGMVEAAAATTLFGTAINFLGKGNVVFLALTVAITAAIAAFSFFSKSNEDVAKKVEAVETAVSASKDKISTYANTAKALADEIDALATKHDRLNSNSAELQAVISQLNNRFRDMGLYVSSATTNVDELINKLQDLRRQQLNDQGNELQNQRIMLGKQLDLQKEANAKLFGQKGARDFAHDNDLTGFGGQATGKGAASGISGPKGRTPSEDRANAIIADVLNTLRKANAPESDSDIDRTLTGLMGFTKKIADLRRDLESSTDASVKEVKDRLDRTAEGIAGIVKNLKAQRGTGYALGTNANDTTRNDAEKSPIGEQLRQLDTSIRQQVSSAKASLQSQEKGPNGSLSITALRAYDETITKISKAASASYSQIISQAGAETVKALEGSPSSLGAQKAIADVRAEAETSNLTINKEDAEVQKAAKKAIEARISALNAKVNGKESYNTIAGLVDQINDQYAKLELVEKNLRSIADKENKIHGTNETGTQTDAEISAMIAEKRGKDLERIRTTLEERERVVAEALKKDDASDIPIKALAADLTRLNKGFTRMSTAIKDVVKAQEAVIAGMETHVNGNSDRFSQVQVEAEKRRLEKVKFDADRAQLGNINQTLPGDYALLTRAKTLQSGFANQLSPLQSQLDSTATGDMNLPETQALITHITLLKQRGLESDKEVLAIQEKIKDLEQQRDDLQVKINSENDPGKEFSIGEGFTAAFQQWRQDAGMMKSINVQVIDSFKSMFDITANAMGQFATNIVTRTKTIGQAFKDMVMSILSSMAQMLMNTAAGQLLGFAISGISGLFSGGDITSGGGVSTGGGGGGFGPGAMADGSLSGQRQGGLIRARQGRYIHRVGGGGVPGRDSVPVLAMPGEYFLQKSAVDSLGPKFVNKLNTMGARALDTNIPLVGQDKGGAGTVNVWIVPPDQVPPPGPKDIVQHVADDLNKGGITKKLVQQIQLGRL